MHDEIPLTDLQAKIATTVEYSLGQGKHHARSAVSHLHCAWTLRNTDLEMAAFRALTSEEEAATAIFHALKRLHYTNADKLNPKKHEQKVAVYAFTRAVEESMGKDQIDKLEPKLEFDETGLRPIIRTRITILAADGKPRWVYPTPSLGFQISKDEKVYDFQDELEDICSRRKVKSVLDYLRKRANRRNQLLYASSHGIPKWSGDIDSFILAHRDITFSNLAIFYIIDQHNEKQIFVQQCLDAFLKMFNQLPTDIDAN